MENRDDEFYGPKDLLSPATREEFLYIKSDMPTQTGLIEDSPAVAIGLQHDRNHILDWLKENLPPVMLALVILSIVSLTFTGHWNRGPEYAGIPILGNYNEDTVEQKTLIPPDQTTKDQPSYDLRRHKNNSERYFDADKKYIKPIPRINNKIEVSNNLITMDLPLKIEFLQQSTFTITLNVQNTCGSVSNVDSFWVLEPPILKADTLSTLNHLTFLDLKSNKLIGWVDFNYNKGFSNENQNYLSYYDKKGLHWNSTLNEEMSLNLNTTTLKNGNKYIDSLKNQYNELLALTARSTSAPHRKGRLRNTSSDADYYAIKILTKPKTYSNSNIHLSGIDIKSINESICLLNACVTGYQKTDLKIDTSTIVYLSGHSKIIYDNCGITSGPEGIKHLLQNTSPDCTPLDPNYNLGALLFRIGESDAWKPYTGDHMPIKIDKPGVLEFTINLKSTKNIKGNYQVLAYEKASEADRK